MNSTSKQLEEWVKGERNIPGWKTGNSFIAVSKQQIIVAALYNKTYLLNSSYVSVPAKILLKAYFIYSLTIILYAAYHAFPVHRCEHCFSAVPSLHRRQSEARTHAQLEHCTAHKLCQEKWAKTRNKVNGRVAVLFGVLGVILQACPRINYPGKCTLIEFTIHCWLKAQILLVIY